MSAAAIEEGFAALAALVGAAAGLQYMTALRFETGEGGGLASRRVFTTVPEAHPVGETKVFAPSAWLDHVHGRQEVFLADGAEAIRAAYPDHQVVFGLGAVRLANFPVVREGRPVGLLNLAQGEGHDGAALEAAGRAAARLAAFLL